ncbi:hypothetical protein VN97_g3245 [Penicillium thymicola]|uniref:Uncharacterized protein n=1 Tax=Penicillium thymicola TaxID=293382 RepID=A0AAI9TMS0_PENTH|nr:hypothetical protein VN97_g3245 [Penicillium thymicola]
MQPRLPTYDHRLKRTRHPVRSAIHNLEIGGLVVGWVTTSEYPLLYVRIHPIFYPFGNSLLLPYSSAPTSQHIKLSSAWSGAFPGVHPTLTTPRRR